MIALHPELLWLMLLAPLVWWIAQRRATRGTTVVPHLPVLESVLTARDTSPAAPPWRAVALAAGCACAVLAAADLRSMEPAPRRMLVLWWGGAAAGAQARALAADARPGDDVHLLQAGPAGIRRDDRERDPVHDARAPAPDAARASLRQVAGPAGVVQLLAASAPGDAIEALVFELTPGADGVQVTARWRGRPAQPLMPLMPLVGRGTPGTSSWDVLWQGTPIVGDAPLEIDALIALPTGRTQLTAVLLAQDGRPVARTVVTSACVLPEPRPALLVTDGAAHAIDRSLIAALASMPDLIRSAGRIGIGIGIDGGSDTGALHAALAAQPDALLIGLGVGPSAAPGRDWICVEPPVGDPLLPLQTAAGSTYGVAERFSGGHAISRGLSAAGIEIDALRAIAGTGPVGRRDHRYEPLLLTDRGVAAIAGSPRPGTRLVAILGDASRAFAAFPAWPRFLRRSVAWLGTERVARTIEVQRAGSHRAERADDSPLASRLPAWRGRTRGAVRWHAGVEMAGGAADLVLEPDPFRPPPPHAASPQQLPARNEHPAPGDPAAWPALLAALLLIAAVFRLPSGDTSHA